MTEIHSQAKASEDNGTAAKDQVNEVGTGVTGEASRASVGAGTDAPNHRVMTMTPLEPREMNGLRGFGFSIKFEDR
nr:hypothetical protein RAR13_11715 [Aminobacter aminovorans]